MTDPTHRVPPRIRPRPPEFDEADFTRKVERALPNIWWADFGIKAFIGGVTFVALALVGIGYIGQVQLTSMIETREKISNASETIVLRMQKVNDDARNASSEIGKKAQRIRRKADAASGVLSKIPALQEELQNKTLEVDNFMAAKKPFTVTTIWSLSDTWLRIIYVFLVALPIVNILLWIATMARQSVG